MAKATPTDIQIQSMALPDRYGDTWSAFAIVSTAKSRAGRGSTAEDECKMMAVAFAIAGRIEADRAKHFAASKERFTFGAATPEVGLHNYAIHAYVKLETSEGTKEEAQAIVALIDKAIKAFKLSDVGL